MKKTYLAFCAAALSVSMMAASCANDPNPAQEDAVEVAEDRNDAKFDDTRMEDPSEWIAKAAEGGMMEVEFGKLAQTNAANPKVRELGKMMEQDHSKANEELKAIAMQKNVTLPTAMSDEHQNKYKDLSVKKGADFDKAYTEMMVDDHKDDIDRYQEQAKDGKDMELKTFAAGKVPILQGHLQMAEEAHNLVK